MKNVHRVSTKQHGDIKSGVSRSKNSIFSQAWCASCTALLEHVKVQLSPQTRKCDCFAHFCGYNCETSRICHQWARFFTIKAG